MDFFDDLGKRLTNASQTVVQKSKEKIDITNLSAKIEAEKRNLSNCYSAIGKLYIELHHDDFEPEFKEYFSHVHACEKKISEYRQQIKDIKGIQKCRKCGADIPLESLFCGKCGTSVQEENER